MSLQQIALSNEEMEDAVKAYKNACGWKVNCSIEAPPGSPPKFSAYFISSNVRPELYTTEEVVPDFQIDKFVCMLNHRLLYKLCQTPSFSSTSSVHKNRYTNNKGSSFLENDNSDDRESLIFYIENLPRNLSNHSISSDSSSSVILASTPVLAGERDPTEDVSLDDLINNELDARELPTPIPPRTPSPARSDIMSPSVFSLNSMQSWSSGVLTEDLLPLRSPPHEGHILSPEPWTRTEPPLMPLRTDGNNVPQDQHILGILLGHFPPTHHSITGQQADEDIDHQINQRRWWLEARHNLHQNGELERHIPDIVFPERDVFDRHIFLRSPDNLQSQERRHRRLSRRARALEGGGQSSATPKSKKSKRSKHPSYRRKPLRI